MASTPSTRNRLQKQGTGDNINTWGALLNSGAFDLIDAALDGMVSFTLSGSKTLTSANYVADEARMRVINVTGGTGGSIVIPSVEKNYILRNASSGTVTIAPSGGTAASIPSGSTQDILCDGVNCYTVGVSKGYVDGQDTSTLNAAKAYTDTAAFNANAGILPGQAGNAGIFLTTDGTSASWAAPTVAQISDYSADQATRAAALNSFAIAMAVAL